MSWLQWLLQQPTPTSITGDVLPFLGGILASVFTWLGVRSSRTAPLQESVNDALRLLMKELQVLHAQDTARISELEGMLLFRDGEIRNLKQKISSLFSLCQRAGLAVPKEADDAER